MLLASVVRSLEQYAYPQHREQPEQLPDTDATRVALDLRDARLVEARELTERGLGESPRLAERAQMARQLRRGLQDQGLQGVRQNMPLDACMQYMTYAAYRRQRPSWVGDRARRRRGTGAGFGVREARYEVRVEDGGVWLDLKPQVRSTQEEVATLAL